MTLENYGGLAYLNYIYTCQSLYLFIFVDKYQNWDFLKSVVEQLNRQPSKQHGTDIMRIRPWYVFLPIFSNWYGHCFRVCGRCRNLSSLLSPPLKCFIYSLMSLYFCEDSDSAILNKNIFSRIGKLVGKVLCTLI